MLNYASLAKERESTNRLYAFLSERDVYQSETNQRQTQTRWTPKVGGEVIVFDEKTPNAMDIAKKTEIVFEEKPTKLLKHKIEWNDWLELYKQMGK
ncbi:MAG: hypothetical protein ACP5N2_00405 [Candidatus Nanoarchaeia archaeon]